ncbi:MAG: hypothetical protein ACRD0A_12260 [Acidimicrobiales bacterium]
MRHTSRTSLPIVIGVAVAGVALSACADDTPSTTAVTAVIDPGDGGEYDPMVDRASFVETIDNAYLPLGPGSRWVYEDTSGAETERIEVIVTSDRREIMGISATVVRDTVTVDGEVVEDTFDWFAQDGDGNVWYLGEATAEYEGGEVVSTDGSWEAGVDGALPGIVMLASPSVGDAYRQEYYVGEAEDLAEVVRVGDEVDVASGSFVDVVVIEEWNPFEPETIEEKFYAPGVGVVLEVTTAGGEGRVELVAFVPGP